MEIRRSGNKITVGSVESKILSERSPANINWENVDVVIEASGVFLTLSDCDGHLKTAKRVIITAPSPNATMYVYGVNHSEYKGEKIISNASCTTNCLAAIAKVVHENFGIDEGLMTTVHATTNSQHVVDTCAAKRSKRSCFNIIPASTGAAKALSKVIPALEGKMTGMAFRVPVLNVSVVDLTVRLERATTLEKILEKVKDAAKGDMKGVLCYTDEEVVSGDYNRCGMSCVFDYKASIALNDKFFKLVCWYDNEYGYSCRVVDMALYIHDK
ncbi:UNVERIFIED_CONTAM: hypothetical protein PYX00_011580 [Menopon gallinae]|uniref:Glyceraldehyde 3-phosphate dehydrogenase NAD(P) binding domain-containing protein n=1 Tax=Menopon gallinae TaxID=328185 RepID=A0AAW2H8Q4_9NEOP